MPSQRTNIAKRNARIAQLFFVEGLETTDIAERLMEEGLLESKSEESAKKTVRNEIARIKEHRRADAEQNEDDQTAKERHLARMGYAVRKLVALIENEDVITKVIGMTKDGTPVTTEVPAVTAAVKQKAMKDLAAISERIAVVTGVEIGALKPKGADGAEDDAPTQEFAFHFSGKTLSDLIGMRTGKTEVN
jgi:hypothetical protein